MRCFQATTLIDAPAGNVWSVLADVVAWPQWLPTVTSVEALDAPALAVGSRFRVVQPRLRPTVWTVVEVVPQGLFSWESLSPGVRALARHVLTSASGGSTRVSLEITFSGLLAGLVGLTAGRLTREYIEREAVTLKERVESGPLN
jgi:uncharacterized membrane protein